MAAAIERNKAKASYIEQAPYFDRRKLEVQVHQFSVTQGEVSLFYDGQFLGRYGDKYTISAGGQWRGHPLRYWEDAAKKILRERHLASLQRAA
ncbi:hypothetical protein [Sinorhizobium medicae]